MHDNIDYREIGEIMFCRSGCSCSSCSNNGGGDPYKEAFENRIIVVHDIVEENGKTIKENNLERTHAIPLGALVETYSESEYGWEGIRLFVTKHTRDCDGTPLYSLGAEGRSYTHGFSDSCLKVIKEE